MSSRSSGGGRHAWSRRRRGRPEDDSTRVKILVVHNRYQHAGGEDEVFAAECGLLRDAGHDVHEYVRTNDDIALSGALGRIRLAAGTVWAHREQESLREVIGRIAPDVAHFHNTFP